MELFSQFKIFKDNWKLIRDEALSVGYEKYGKHPQCDLKTYRELNTGENLGIVLCAGTEVLENNIKLFPKTWEMYESLDLSSKQSIGFSYLTPDSAINPHNDPEDCYRYHLCLQSENNKSNIFGTLSRDTKSDLYINEGEAVILEPCRITHRGINESKTIKRLHLVIDFLDGYENKSAAVYQSLNNKQGWEN